MKNLLMIFPKGLISKATARMSLSLLLTAILATGLWVATSPVARARAMTPAEMIQENLPPGKTMKSATKPQFLSAVCAAVKKHRDVAPEITKVAVSTHREYAGDIVATVLRCATNVDCEFVGAVVRAAVRAAPDEASTIADAALAIVPDCADAIQQASNIPGEGPDSFGGGPTTQLPLPGSTGGGGGGVNPEDQLILICDNGTQRTVRESLLGGFLSSHPGSFVGSCQPTPTTNK
jgi:hypothetical protein